MMAVYYLAKDYIKGLPYRSFKYMESRKPAMHQHDFWELVYVYEGIGEHHTESRSAIITEGTILLISPNTAHTTISNADAGRPPVRVINFLVTVDFFDLALEEYLKTKVLQGLPLYELLENKDTFCIQLEDNELKTLRGYFYDVNRECGRKELHADTIVKNSLINLLVESTRIYRSAQKDGQENTNTDDLSAMLMRYMKANLSSKITLCALSEQVHLAPAYLSRYFSEHTGMTISEYLTKIRIERAAELLGSTSYSITEISALCGYSSLGNFQRYFKKLIGMAPSEYRVFILKGTVKKVPKTDKDLTC